MQFFPVSPTIKCNILLVDWILPLQCSKQSHYLHRALCELEKWWNKINCTDIKIRYNNDFINNHQYQTHDSVLKINVILAVIFLSTCKINVSELNFKRPIVTTQWHCVQTSVYLLPALFQISFIQRSMSLIEEPSSRFLQRGTYG